MMMINTRQTILNKCVRGILWHTYFCMFMQHWYGNAFSNHPTLVEATIGGDATEIQNQMFNNCKVLKKVTLGDKITRIGSDAFHGCDILDDINLSEPSTALRTARFITSMANRSTGKPFKKAGISSTAKRSWWNERYDSKGKKLFLIEKQLTIRL